MGIFSSDKHKKSDDTSNLPKKAKKIKTEKQKANRRQSKVVEQKTDKKSTARTKLW